MRNLKQPILGIFWPVAWNFYKKTVFARFPERPAETKQERKSGGFAVKVGKNFFPGHSIAGTKNPHANPSIQYTFYLFEILKTAL